MAMRIGSHVDKEDPIAEAVARGADAVQIFLGEPQSWKAPTVAYPGGAAALKAAAEQADLAVYVHAAYIINVASPNNRIRIPSRKLLQQTVKLAAEAGARGVVVHGGHVAASDDPDAGFENWRKAVDQLEQHCPVFIENTAGGDHAMARRLEAIAKLWDAVGHSGIGLCLDTCHAFAGGIPLESAVADIKAVTGRIDLVHANDSQGGFDSGVDRHANFGEGVIDSARGEGAALIAQVIAEAGCDAICETPNGPEAQAADIKFLRERVA
ncbi:deoxyribonuclease IV [Catenulispora subtropica]|uniref:Deoxyribonuclease IV n=1 Tax=Catenulispora subtropica TaxID=450798 RepID=A0ABN2QDP3_9ACTN